MQGVMPMEPLKRIIGEAHVAVVYGMEEAVFLDAIMFWYRTNRGNGSPVHCHDGRWWTYNSVRAFEDIFPWWNAGQIRRIIARCKEKGALLSGNFNRDQRDRTVWYSPSDELLALYGEPIGENCICGNQQMETPEPSAECDENGEPLPCSTHDRNNNVPPYSPPGSAMIGTQGRLDRSEGESPGPAQRDRVLPETEGKRPGSVPNQSVTMPKPRRSRQKKSVPTHAPERFEQFWAAYPGGGSRLKAVAAWDALAPDDALIDEMARALKRQMRSQQWRDGVGIPHASTWLNNARWTDKLPEAPKTPPGSSTGLVYDPEAPS